MIELLQKHRQKGAALETNILLAWVVGSYDPDLLGAFKRVENFEPQDADLLRRLIQWLGSIIVTPNVMTEVANLCAQMGEPRRAALFSGWSTQISTYTEDYVPSRDVAADSAFARLFLTNMTLVDLCRRGRLILTDDWRLAGVIHSSGGDVMNFNHVRQIDWKAS